MFKAIVLATDLSPASERVVRCVQAWKPFGLERVVVAHVHNIRATGGSEELLRSDHAPKLDDQVESLRAASLDASWRLEFGVPYVEMNRIAKEAAADAVVIGTHGKTWLREVCLGSIGAAILRRSAVPVVVIKVNRLQDMPLEDCAGYCAGIGSRILLATDFSSASDAALSAVEQICVRAQSSVHLLHVQELTRIQPHLADRLEEFNRLDAERLEKMAGRLRAAGACEVEYSLRADHPVTGILATIEATQPTLVAVGSQGRGQLAELFMGSTAHAVACKSPVPVLVVPARMTA